MAERRLNADEVKRLYDRHGPALMLHARYYVADGAMAEDVVHGVFLRLLGRSDAMIENPAGYLYRAVKNAALNAVRDRSRDTSLPDPDLWFADAGRDQEAALALQQALSELPDDQREVVIMRVWSGLTFEEMAESIGVPLHTAASRYRYALSKLRDALKPRQEWKGKKSDGF